MSLLMTMLSVMISGLYSPRPFLDFSRDLGIGFNITTVPILPGKGKGKLPPPGKGKNLGCIDTVRGLEGLNVGVLTTVD